MPHAAASAIESLSLVYDGVSFFLLNLAHRVLVNILSNIPLPDEDDFIFFKSVSKESALEVALLILLNQMSLVFQSEPKKKAITAIFNEIQSKICQVQSTVVISLYIMFLGAYLQTIGEYEVLAVQISLENVILPSLYNAQKVIQMLGSEVILNLQNEQLISDTDLLNLLPYFYDNIVNIQNKAFLSILEKLLEINKDDEINYKFLVVLAKLVYETAVKTTRIVSKQSKTKNNSVALFEGLKLITLLAGKSSFCVKYYVYF